MNIQTTVPLLILGFMVGIQIMVTAFMAVMPTVVKIPGAQCATYLTAGFIALVGGFLLYGRVRMLDSLAMHMLVMAVLLAAYLLIWVGDRYFRQQRPGKSMWLIAAAVFIVFTGLGLGGMSPDMMAVYIALCAALFWIFFAWKVHAGTTIRATLPTFLLIGGVSLMVANSMFRAAISLHFFPSLVPLTTDNSFLFSRFIGAMLGGVMTTASYVRLYFERVVQHSNHAASHDELTGLLNRRAIVANGQREIELARRNRQPLAVAFVDIDFFKKINDTYGHDQGDVALREVALVLQQNCRSVDLIGRYGGEEFCMILPGDDHAGAESVGERLLAAVREHVIEGLPPVTISIGLAVLDLDDPEQTWHSLISLADAELYKAKHGGRNRFSIALTTVRAEAAPARSPAPTLAAAG